MSKLNSMRETENKKVEQEQEGTLSLESTCSMLTLCFCFFIYMSDLGFIKVLKANYGRTDHTTCASGIPANQISNTHCFQETSLYTMSTR